MVRRPSAEAEGAEENKSLARTIDYTEETGDPNHSEPSQETNQEDTQPLVPNSSSSTLHAAAPTTRLSAASNTEAQSISATSFATALQSQRNSEHVS